MTVWTVVVSDRPTAAFSAANEQEAHQALEDEYGVRDDLMVLEDEQGQPLWSGDEEALFVRQATPEEYRIWRLSYAEVQDDPDFAQMDDRDDPAEWLVFLIPVRDPTDDE